MSIERTIAAWVTAALLMVAASAASAGTIFTSILTGDQEVPANASPHSGVASYTLRIGGVLEPSLEFDLVFDPVFNFGLVGSTGTKPVTGLHIHQAPRGANGPIVFGIFGPVGPVDDDDNDIAYSLLADGSTRVTGEWDALEGRADVTFASLASFFTDAAPGADTPFYLNLHTTDFTGGEIRGQIVAVPVPGTLALLAGALLLLTGRRWAM